MWGLHRGPSKCSPSTLPLNQSTNCFIVSNFDHNLLIGKYFFHCSDVTKKQELILFNTFCGLWPNNAYLLFYCAQHYNSLVINIIKSVSLPLGGGRWGKAEKMSAAFFNVKG